MTWTRIGVDIGGTFTDVAVIGADGKLEIGKRLTTHGNEEAGVIQAVGDTAADITRKETILAHGTTLVINALLERKGARVGLVTTKGFADIIELGRANRPDIFNIKFRRDPVLVPAVHRYEVDERCYPGGEIVRRPDEGELAALVEVLKRDNIEAVAIGFLHSYEQPANERVVAAYLRKALPDVPVTISSDLSREWREYERFTTVAANAYVIPVADRYIAKLEAGLEQQNFAGDFIVLDSGGGAMSVAMARQYPVQAIESGPVAGVLRGQELARELKLENLVTFDMGGTTAKTCLVENGRYGFTDLYWVNGHTTGFPLQVRTVDVTEVGAGGGSIAWVDDAGRLRVGPRSASSVPGPACYGRGGTEPTVTDANLYCGHLATAKFSSSLRLDEAACSSAIDRLAKRAGLTPSRLALGIIKLANVSMAAAVRRQTLERGRDPREFTLLAVGGGGPMHACEVAAEVGIGSVLIPRYPGHFSALGMLSANLKVLRTEILLRKLANLSAEDLEKTLRRAASEVRGELVRGPTDSTIELHFSYALALRYKGQEHTLLAQAPVSGIDVPQDVNGAFKEVFLSNYLTRFGHVDPDGIIEVVSVEIYGERVLPHAAAQEPAGRQEPQYETKSMFGDDTTVMATPVVSRSSLSPDSTFAGPMIIYEDGATTVIPPGAKGRVIAGGNLLVDVTALIDRQTRSAPKHVPIHA